MRILLTAGGTGGHIMPAMAIMEAMRDLRPDTGFLFVGTDRGLEEKFARQYGVDFIPVKSLGIKGKSAGQIIKAVAVNCRAFIKALVLATKFRPDWVIGTGGYITGMVVLAGRLSGAKCALHEQNSIPGLTNRLLARLASRIYLAFPDIRNIFPAGKKILTGNPVRKEIKPGELPGDTLLIMGGSLGAASINRTAVKALSLLKEEGIDIKVIHQTGPADIDWVSQAYGDNQNIQARAFIDNMQDVYSRSRMAICRAGGLSLAEASRMGIPVLMVPFPKAADDHQMANARHIEASGGGWVVPDHEFTPEKMAQLVREYFFNQTELDRKRTAMQALGLGEGARRIAEEILGV